MHRMDRRDIQDVCSPLTYLITPPCPELSIEHLNRDATTSPLLGDEDGEALGVNSTLSSMGVLHDACGMHDALYMLLEDRCGERLSEEVGQVVIGVDMFRYHNVSIPHFLYP